MALMPAPQPEQSGDLGWGQIGLVLYPLGRGPGTNGLFPEVIAPCTLRKRHAYSIGLTAFIRSASTK